MADEDERRGQVAEAALLAFHTGRPVVANRITEVEAARRLRLRMLADQDRAVLHLLERRAHWSHGIPSLRAHRRDQLWHALVRVWSMALVSASAILSAWVFQ